MSKYVCFRFDVDTHRCLRQGVPPLLELARTLNVPFTFFVNMGRAVSQWDSCRRLLGVAPAHQVERITRLPTLHKLGLRDYLVAALLNPRVGVSQPQVLRAIHAAGHEIGLHGGYNHATWQARGARWPVARLRAEIAWGLAQLQAAGIGHPAAFASPGWQGSEALHDVLASLDFAIVADAHGDGLEAIGQVNGHPCLRTVPTNIVGEPGGVGYLEHLRASGLSRDAAMDDFARRLAGTQRLAVVYDHPCVAGLALLPLVRSLIDIARSLGCEIVTISDAVQRLASGPP